MIWVIEAVILVVSITLWIYALTYRNPIQGMMWYPKDVQKEAIARGLVSEEYIRKRKKLGMYGYIGIQFIIILVSIFIVNDVDTYLQAFLGISLLALIANLWDAIVVDYFWVRKTKYWYIVELSDLEIAKPVKQIIQERISSSIFMIVLSAVLACLVFIL